MATYKYESFERWFDEPEDWGLRSERFFDVLRPYDQRTNELVERWIQAAFEAGREEKIERRKQIT